MSNDSRQEPLEGSRRVRVLHIFATLGLGGAEARTVDIFRHIRQHNVTFDFLTMTTGEQHFTKTIYDLGGRIYHARSPRAGILGHLVDIWRILKEAKPDVVHAHTSYHAGLVLLLAKLSGVAQRIAHSRVRGTESVDSKRIDIPQRLGKLLISLAATDLIATSPEAARYLFGSKPSMIIPNAFELNDYLLQRSQSVARAELQLPSDALIMGQIGRFDPVKNHERSLRLAHRLITHHRVPTKLVFLGAGRQEHHLRELATNYSIEDHVVFAGQQTNIPCWMDAFDVLLMPSIYEGLANAVVEAQASGKGVVASTGVPRLADMGLGLVRFVELEKTDDEWVDAILAASELPRLSPDTILQAFDERAYTLQSAAKQYASLYRSSRAKRNRTAASN